MITVACPKCGANYSVKDEYGGKTIKCKKCAAAIPVPLTTKTPETGSVPDSPFAFVPIPDPPTAGDKTPGTPASEKPRRGLLLGGIVGGGLAVCLLSCCCGGIGTYWYFPDFIPFRGPSVVGTWEQEGSRIRQREFRERKERADHKILMPPFLLAQEPRPEPEAEDERNLAEIEIATLFEFSRWGSGKVIEDRTTRKDGKVSNRQKKTVVEFNYTFTAGNPGILEMKYKKAHDMVNVDQETIRVEVRFDADRKGMSWKKGPQEIKLRRLD